MKCIICQTNEVNPMIGGVEGPYNKSYCSRICENLDSRFDLKHLDNDAIKRLALAKLKELEEKDGWSNKK